MCVISGTIFFFFFFWGGGGGGGGGGGECKTRENAIFLKKGKTVICHYSIGCKPEIF